MESNHQLSFGNIIEYLDKFLKYKEFTKEPHGKIDLEGIISNSAHNVFVRDLENKFYLVYITYILLGLITNELHTDIKIKVSHRCDEP